MKRNFRSTMLVILFFAAFAMSVAPTAQAQDEGGCSNATAAGKWGFTTAGTVFLASGPAPAVVVGSFKLDAAGNLEGTQTRSLNGLPVNRETISGTILVNSDCTAAATISVFHSGVLNRTATLDLVFVENLRGVRGVFTSAITAGGVSIGNVLTFDGKKQLTGD
jgi:hypothetical protein